jgi:hypothetical protein
VEPTIAEVPSDCPLLQEEVFAPIMYVVKVSGLDHAIQLNNDVPQVTPITTTQLHTHRTTLFIDRWDTQKKDTSSDSARGQLDLPMLLVSCPYHLCRGLTLL